MGVRLKSPEGEIKDVPESKVNAALDAGFKPLPGAEGAAFEQTPTPDTSVGAKVVAGVSSGLAGATLGGTDALTRIFASKGTVRDVARARADNSGVSTVAGIGGAILPTLVTGGESLPVSLAGDAGVAAAEAVGGGVAGVLARGGVEGGLIGLGQGISDVSLSQDPLTVERVAGTLSSNMLFGGMVGAGAGTIGKLVEKGLSKTAGALDRFASESRAAQVTGAVPEDLATATNQELRGAESTEYDRLGAEQTQRARQSAPMLDQYRKDVRAANPWLVIDAGEDAGLLNSSERKIRDALNDPEGIARKPDLVLKKLREQETALSRAYANKDEIAAKLGRANARIADNLAEELASLPDKLTEVELSGKAARRYGAFADVKIGKKAAITVARDDAQKFLEALTSGQVKGASQQALEAIPSLIEKNKALQNFIETNTQKVDKLKSPRLDAIANRRIQIEQEGKPNAMKDMVRGSVYGTAASFVASHVPIIGPAIGPYIGAKLGALATEKVFGRMGTAAANVAERTSQAIGKFLDVSKRFHAAPAVIATKVLNRTAFAPQSGDEKQGGLSLAEAYRKRADELRSQTAYDETGTSRIRPDARAQITHRLRAMSVVSPVVSDLYETAAVARLEFLANKLAKRPDVEGLPIGPDKWEPSELQMRQFARYVSAVEDPSGVEERLAAGTVTPEDAEAYRTVYPQRFEHLQQQIVSQLPTLRKTIPYERKLALTIFSGVPVDPACDPRILTVLQGGFAQEPGSAGGMQAPAPVPQFGNFGSIKKSPDEPTPAQARAGK